MRRTKTVTRLIVAFVVLGSVTGCASGVRRFKAVDVLTQPCEAAAPMSRVLQVLVTDESGSPLPGVFITAAWGNTRRSFITALDGRGEVEAQQEPAKLRVQLSGHFPVEVTDVAVGPGCRATYAVRLGVRVDCRYAECD